MPLDFSGKGFLPKKGYQEVPSDEASSSQESEEFVENNKSSAIWNVISPKYTLEDMILENSVKDELLDITAYYVCMDKLMEEWGLAEKYQDRTNLTVNLYGDSGSGKTMAAHSIAHALGKMIIFVDYAEIESKYVGETAKNLKQLFISALESDAVIIFDEADALLSKRVTDMRSSTDVSVNQTRSVLLNILNEYTGVVIFTTNFIQNFDPAFIRRIRYQIKFNLPNEELRKKLWKMYIPDKLPTNVNIEVLSSQYEGVSGSDISNAVFSASIKAARLGSDIVEHSMFENAIKSILKAKKENSGIKETITKRVVSEEYVKEQLNVKEI